MKPSGAAEKAIKEKERIWRAYTTARRQRRQELYREHPMGPELENFAAMLRRFGAEDGEAFLTYVRESNRQWLMTAPPDIRLEALAMVGERVQRIRARAGMVPFDDPLPEEDDDVFRLCRQELT